MNTEDSMIEGLDGWLGLLPADEPVGRKRRKDSKLGSLPLQQLALVNKWLFDKGMTYEQVAEACGQMFGLSVSRSSVARYYADEAARKVERVEVAASRGPECEAPEGMSEEESYEWCLGRMAEEAVAYGTGPEEFWDWRLVSRVMRVSIAARTTRTEARLMRLRRRRFELWAARKCLQLMRKLVGRRGEMGLVRGGVVGYISRPLTEAQCGQRLNRNRKKNYGIRTTPPSLPERSAGAAH